MKNSDERKNKQDPADGSGGQNPFWPGEGLRMPGEIIKDDGKDDNRAPEITIIPIVR